jgi:hypothetical protein
MTSTAGATDHPQHLQGSSVLILVLCAFLFSDLAGQQLGSTASCPPRDDALQDAELVAVRSKLREAVARKDAAGVLKITDPHIRTSFGSDDGLEFFKRDLSSKRNPIWDELGAVLALGGVFETPGTFVAPFSTACGEPGEEVVVVGRHVRVRARPEPTAPVQAEVSFVVLRMSDSGSDPNWQGVRLPDGRRGFIAARFVRSPIGYRAYFSKINGAWRLTAFIGGD